MPQPNEHKRTQGDAEQPLEELLKQIQPPKLREDIKEAIRRAQEESEGYPKPFRE